MLRTNGFLCLKSGFSPAHCLTDIPADKFPVEHPPISVAMLYSVPQDEANTAGGEESAKATYADVREDLKQRYQRSISFG